MFLLRKPRVWLAFFVVLSMCGDHERSSAMVTPRYFAAEALSCSTLCKMYLVFRGLTFLVMWRTWHLEGLNCISHIFSHCSRHARSVCRTWPSVVKLIARYMAVSSAKSYSGFDLLWQVIYVCKEENWTENRALWVARGDWNLI